MAKEGQPVERSVADLRTPVTDGVAPPASKDPSTLPFRARSWPDFERILLQYAEHVDGLRSARIYGVPGQAQHGIDLYGTDAAGETVAYQAKNVKAFTAASLRAAVKKFNDGPPPLLGVRRLVVCTACRTDDTKVGEEFEKQRRANPNLTIDLYDARTLSEGLRGRPDLVRRLFGAAWQVVFCDDVGWEVPTPSSIDALADSLVRGPLAAFGLRDTLNRADALAGTDPAQAAELVGQVIKRVAFLKSMSVRLRPRISLRRMPVMAASHRSGNRRWPAAVRRNCCSCWAVHACCSTLGIDRSRGDRAMSAKFRVSSPRRTASSRAPRMTRWTS
jgi:hypothetical protein